MNIDKKLLKHGMSIACIIDNVEINNAKISINEDGKIYICQNMCDGGVADNKLGYKYSWNIGNIKDTYISNSIKFLLPTNKDIKNGVQEDDILIDNRGERKVLGICGKVIILSECNEFDVVGESFTLKELIEYGYILKKLDIETIPEYTMEDAIKKMGYTFKIVE